MQQYTPELGKQLVREYQNNPDAFLGASTTQPNQVTATPVGQPKPHTQKATGPDVDWDFIKAREGNKESMYVPKADDGTVLDKSGPTIGMGVDLGAWTAADFKKAGVSQAVITKLKGYFGLKKKAADDYVTKNPLTLTTTEVDEVNKAIKGKILKTLVTKFNAESKTKFEDLSQAKQTAVASVFFQYGPNKPTDPKKLADWPKNYWKEVTTGDWDKAESNLNNFSDKYPTRRKLEGKLLTADRKEEFRNKYKKEKDAGAEIFEWRGKKYTTK